jgi:hypothetical protein
MTRQTHGQYDRDKRLPDNNMQAVGSGINVWLNGQVIALLGEQEGRALIEQAAPHDEKRYKWTLEQLATRGYDLRAEYHEREKEVAAQRALRLREQQLAGWKQRLEEAVEPQRRVHIQKEIIKCERYIEARKPKTMTVAEITALLNEAKDRTHPEGHIQSDAQIARVQVKLLAQVSNDDVKKEMLNDLYLDFVRGGIYTDHIERVAKLIHHVLYVF